MMGKFVAAYSMPGLDVPLWGDADDARVDDGVVNGFVKVDRLEVVARDLRRVDVVRTLDVPDLVGSEIEFIGDRHSKTAK